jgi:hypothetical protein
MTTTQVFHTDGTQAVKLREMRYHALVVQRMAARARFPTPYGNTDPE